MSSQVFAMDPDDEGKKNIVELQNNINETIDTSKWITHPVGRYLIKLPPTAQIIWGPLSFGSYGLTWEKGLSYDSALAQLKENENKRKNEMKKEMEDDDWREYPVSTRLQENFSPQKRGTLLTVDYDTPKYDGVSYDMYVINKKNPMNIDFPERIYYLEKGLIPYTMSLSEDGMWLSNMKGEEERSPNTRIAAEKFITHVADNIAPHDPSLPIETVRGIYFNGGFLFDPLDDTLVYPKDERIWIEVKFIDYPGAILKISFDDYPYKIEENSTIVSEPENERLITFTKHDNTPLYRFTFKSSYRDVSMKLETPTYNDGTYKWDVPELDKPSFESDEEAIAFWNAIKENMRWRPDNWKVKAPDAPYFMVYEEIIPAIIPQ